LRGGWWNGLLAGFFGGLMLIGRDQIALLCAFILLIYALWNMFVTPWRVSLVPFGMALVTGLITIALPISLTLVLAEQSTRTEIDFEGAARGSLHPAAFLTAFVVNLFGTDGPIQNFWGPPEVSVWGGNYNLARNMANVYFGALPLVVFLGLGVFAGRVFRRDMAPFVISFVLMLLYTLGDFTPFYKMIFHVPGLDLFRRPADATFPLCALASILAGYALHRFITDENKSFIRNALMPTLVVVSGLAISVAVAWWKDRLALAQTPVLIGAGFLGFSLIVLFLLRRFNRQIGAASLLLVAGALTFDLAVSNGPNESTALPSSRFEVMRTDTKNETIALLRQKLAETAGPDRIDRVELAAVGFDWPNLGLIHGFQHDLGYNPVRLSWFVDATAAQDQVAVVESVKAASEVYAPASGQVSAINDALEANPGLVNEAPQGAGWFFKMTLSDTSQLASLMDEAAYQAFVASLG
jgi:glycine cleavage system H lipoate-binding protein